MSEKDDLRDDLSDDEKKRRKAALLAIDDLEKKPVAEEEDEDEDEDGEDEGEDEDEEESDDESDEDEDEDDEDEDAEEADDEDDDGHDAHGHDEGEGDHEDDPYWWTPHAVLAALLLLGIAGFFGAFRGLVNTGPGDTATAEPGKPAAAASAPRPGASAARAAMSAMAQPGQGEQIGAQHILVMHKESMRAPPGITRSKEEAKTRAQEALDKIKKGASFDDIAKEYTDEPGAKNKTPPGDLGMFTKGRMVPPFETAAFGLKVGQMSDLVETPFGYHVIKRTKLPALSPPLRPGAPPPGSTGGGPTGRRGEIRGRIFWGASCWRAPPRDLPSTKRDRCAEMRLPPRLPLPDQQEEALRAEGGRSEENFWWGLVLARNAARPVVDEAGSLRRDACLHGLAAPAPREATRSPLAPGVTASPMIRRRWPSRRPRRAALHSHPQTPSSDLPPFGPAGPPPVNLRAGTGATRSAPFAPPNPFL
jgi:parvulin-like peptidyl-prolyl isomerase